VGNTKVTPETSFLLSSFRAQLRSIRSANHPSLEIASWNNINIVYILQAIIRRPPQKLPAGLHFVTSGISEGQLGVRTWKTLAPGNA
jgi:hypothetical protein